MQLPTEDIAQKDIARIYKKHFDFADAVFDKTRTLFSGKVPPHSPIVLCLMPVLTRMMRLHYCCIKLASMGCALEGKLQGRAMFENLVNVLALEYSDNQELCARRWIAWDLANHLKQLRAYVSDHPETASLLTEKKEILKETKSAISLESGATARLQWPADVKRQAKYVKDRWKLFVTKGPSMRDLRENAGFVDKKIPGGNLQRTYDQFYTYASGVMHGSDIKTLVEADKIEEKKVILKLAPSKTDIPELIVTSSFFLGRAASSVSRVVKLGGSNFTADINNILATAPDAG